MTSDRIGLDLDRSNWKPVRFDQVIESVTDRVDDPATSGVDRYVGLEHLDSNSLQIDRWGLPTDVAAQKLLFAPNDVIFARRRAYQRKVGSPDFEGICSAHALVLRAIPGRIDPTLLPFFISSESFLSRAIEISVGSLSPTVNWRDLRVQEFVLPAFDDQGTLARLLQAAESMRASLSRRLIAFDELRRRHMHDRMEKIARTAGTLPLESLIDIKRPITYGILMPGSGYEGGVPVIKVKDYPGGEVVQENLLLTSPKIALEYRRSTLRAGDLIISIRGTIGRLAEVPPQLDGANITQDTARLAIDSAFDTGYVRMALESDFVQSQIRRNTTGLAVQGINLGALRQIRVPMARDSDIEMLTQEVLELAAASAHLDAEMKAAAFALATIREEIFQ